MPNETNANENANAIKMWLMCAILSIALTLSGWALTRVNAHEALLSRLEAVQDIVRSRLSRMEEKLDLIHHDLRGYRGKQP